MAASPSTKREIGSSRRPECPSFSGANWTTGAFNTYIHTRLNEVSYNKIGKIATYLQDVTGIYVSNGVTNDGSDIHHNFFYECDFTNSRGIWGAIRADDETQDHYFHHNIIKNICYAGIILKNKGYIYNNFILALENIVQVNGSDYHNGGVYFAGEDAHTGSQVYNNILYILDGESDKIWQENTNGQNVATQIGTNFDDNLYIGDAGVSSNLTSKKSSFSPCEANSVYVATASIGTVFTDWQNDNYTLGTVATNLGIENINFAEIGVGGID